MPSERPASGGAKGSKRTPNERVGRRTRHCKRIFMVASALCIVDNPFAQWFSKLNEQGKKMRSLSASAWAEWGWCSCLLNLDRNHIKFVSLFDSRPRSQSLSTQLDYLDVQKMPNGFGACPFCPSHQNS